MKNLRVILSSMILAAVVVGFGAFGVLNAGAADAHYTDGTETYTFGPTVNGVQVGFGAPPEAPHFETIDGTSNLCIDPPGEAWMTIHRTDGDPMTFLYFPNPDTVILHGVPHVCHPLDVPVCPADTFEDFQVTFTATWDIGTGVSAPLVIDVDCPDRPVPPVVEPPGVVPPAVVAPPAAPPVPVAAPATPVCNGNEQLIDGVCSLPHTGSETAALAGWGVAAAGIGCTMIWLAKSKRRAGLDV